MDIMNATMRGDVAAVRAWLESGGDASALCDRGNSIISVAAFNSDAAMVRLLLTAARPAKANFADEGGWTALYAAARTPNPDVVALLCDFGADANAAMRPKTEYDSDGEPCVDEPNPPTPLMCAADFSLSPETVRVLLSRGADFAVTDSSGRTAEAYARETLGRPAVKELCDVVDLGFDSARQALAHTEEWRLAGEGERIIELLAAVRAAGSWKRYVGAWRVQLLLLQRLSATERAVPRTELIQRLAALPPPLVGKVASYWRTDRDPLY